MPYGTYNNTLDDVLANPSSEIAWMQRNKLNPLGFDKTTQYISSAKVNDAKFPAAVLSCYWNKINLGVAYSSIGEVDNTIAYNKRQTDSRKKLTHITSEIEWWNSVDVATAKAIIGSAYIKAGAAGIKAYTYAGWDMTPDMCDFLVNNTHGLFLHCYRTTAQANTKDDLYKYCKSRLDVLSASAKKLGKIYPVSIIFSAEPAFMYDYFKTHKWTDAYGAFMTSYNSLATATTKQWLVMDGSIIFVSKYMHLIKP